jgi:hypothetical protein
MFALADLCGTEILDLCELDAEAQEDVLSDRRMREVVQQIMGPVSAPPSPPKPKPTLTLVHSSHSSCVQDSDSLAGMTSLPRMKSRKAHPKQDLKFQQFDIPSCYSDVYRPAREKRLS